MKNTNNFLNNQKYIFGKSEKRKILTIYLSEVKIKNILIILSKGKVIGIGSIIPGIYLMVMYYSIIKGDIQGIDIIGLVFG